VLNDPKHSAALATHKALDLMGGAPRNAEVLGRVWSRFFFSTYYRHHKLIYCTLFQIVSHYDSVCFSFDDFSCDGLRFFVRVSTRSVSLPYSLILELMIPNC